MSGTSIKFALLATLMVIALISASSGPAWAVKAEPNPPQTAKCSSNYSMCMDTCDTMQPKTADTIWAQCVAVCNNLLLSCLAPATSGGRNGQPTNPPNAPLPNAPPKGITGLPPVNVGVNKQPVGGGGTLPPKGPIGVHPISPVNPIGVVEQPPSGGGAGETIYAKGGTVKPPVITTSPIGVTTTTVYDKNGNSTSTNTDPTGKILSKMTTMLGQAGASKVRPPTQTERS